jgi:hypothetical protein
MANVPASGIEPGQRRLNGPQTTGREYRNLSQPAHVMAQEDDVTVPMRDGINLLADVHRPAEPGQYPVLVAASPYPRQIQNLGAPAGFIEAGATDFFVPRGYVHVIANCRGTSGSGGTFGEGYYIATLSVSSMPGNTTSFCSGARPWAVLSLWGQFGGLHAWGST